MMPTMPPLGRPSFTDSGCRYQGVHSSHPPTAAPGTSVLCWIGLLTICLLAGCGSGVEAKKTGTVSGKITVEGKPLTQGCVGFVSSTIGASAGGDLREDGTYTLDGPVPVGEYRVFLTPPGLGDTPPGVESEQPQQELKGVPEKYLEEETTDLTATVKEGENTFDFDLKP